MTAAELADCHGGCTTEAVVAAAGLSMRDLMPLRPSTNGAAPRPPGATVVATYDYVDPHTGTLLYQVVRHSDKSFAQRRPDPDHRGKWLYSLHGVQRCLYRADRLVKLPPGSTIFVVEGEKGVDRLWAEGQPGTCNSGGAGKWQRTFGELLRGHHLLVVCDKDLPGTAHADNVVNSIVGVAASVRNCGAVPKPPTKGADVSDYLDAGHAIADLRAWPLAARIPTRNTGNVNGARPGDDTGAAAPLAAPDTPHLTDVGNSRHLITQHGRDLRWAPHLGWLAWDGPRWRRDDTGEVVRRAERTVLRMYDTALDYRRKASKLIAADDADAGAELVERAKALEAWAKKSEAEPRLTAMIKLAASESAMPAHAAELDADPWLLNCSNGTVDLRSGALGGHRRADLITKSTGVIYDPAATCPTCESFFDRILAGNVQLIRFLQRFLGYSLSGSTREQCLLFLYGLGANGKTTLLGAVRGPMGDYGRVLNFEALLTRHGDKIPNDLATLAGGRFVTSAEAGPGRAFDEVVVKQLTGQDRVSARFFRMEWFDFTPSIKLVIAANAKPLIRGTDPAIWGSFKLVPFLVTIPKEERDRDLPDTLRAECGGIMTWLVQGCRDYQQHGLGEPTEVLAATDEYREAMDQIAPFFAECCVLEPTRGMLASDLYCAYTVWATRTGEAPLSKRTFGFRLAELGLTAGKSGSERWWRGLRLKGDPVQGEFAEAPGA